MTLSFIILAALILVSAVAAMSLRHLVHCALCLVVTFAGLACVYLRLGAQFVGLAQILIYIGAVAILIVMAILLTRGSEPSVQRIASPYPVVGIGIAALVLCGLIAAIGSSGVARQTATVKPDVLAEATTQNIGVRLMTDLVLPLEVAGLLLTAALIGAVIVAMDEKRK